MGSIRELNEDEPTTPSVALSQALVLFTMCIVGLPVEVHVKDGSVFSGIFHTASFDKGYGIALKKARMIKKGLQNANVPNGGLINTLVILPEDLVQVVAEGVMLPVDNVSCAATRDAGAAVERNSVQGSENEALFGGQWNRERQVGVDSPQHPKLMKEVLDVHGSNTSVSGCSNEVKVCKENQAMVAFGQLADGSLSTSDTAVNRKLANESHETSPQTLLTNRITMESRLNPGAKVFTPSIPNMRLTPTSVPTVPSMAYVPNNIPAVQGTAVRPEVGTTAVAQHSSWPLKYVPYANQMPTHADSSFQYSQTQIAGHITMRAQPTGHGAQYQQIQAMPPYVHANPQNAMFGRPTQFVYMHPVTHDLIQSPTAFSQAPHPVLTPHQFHVAKHEGVFASPLQVPTTPPLTINVPQQFAMPSHIDQSQPIFSSVRPIPFIGSNGPYVSKFHEK